MTLLYEHILDLQEEAMNDESILADQKTETSDELTDSITTHLDIIYDSLKALKEIHHV